MEIKPPSNSHTTAINQAVSNQNSTVSNNSSSAVNWKIEQILQAVITKITDKQLFLDIQGIQANTAKPNISNLNIGDTLQLRVEQLKPLPQFRIIALQQPAQKNIINQALKNLAHNEPSLLPILKNIHHVATRPALRPSPLAVEVNAAVRDIFKSIPSTFNLKTVQQIKSHMQNSGVFLESKIRQQIISTLQSTAENKTASFDKQINQSIKPVLDQDLGAQLHRLANIIKLHISTEASALGKTNAPHIEASLLAKNINSQNSNANQATRTLSKEAASLINISQREEAMQTFLRQTESSISHLQHNQLQTMNDSQSGRLMWLLELPIKDGHDVDVFECKIGEEESNEDGDNKKIWNVTLQFNLQGLGKVKAHIKMQNETISVNFYSEEEQTLSLFQKHLDFLRGRLNYNGMNVGNLECSQKNLSLASNTSQHTTLMKHQIDERT